MSVPWSILDQYNGMHFNDYKVDFYRRRKCSHIGYNEYALIMHPSSISSRYNLVSIIKVKCHL